MKKFLLISLLAFGLGYFAQAQVSPHAFGLRFGGDGNINGAELSFQSAVGSNNRFEFDLGFGGNSKHNRLYLVGIYHWNFNIVGGLNWYLGPGASVGFYTYDHDPGYLNLALGGQIGIEYNFNAIGAPILLSLDARPMWDFLGDHAGLGWGAALGLRYTW
ncbi:MAG: hypothetical protein PHE33_06665 [Bacteroidales bacterium]|nr:hypothetical protein [Bacteroidales bacterium]